MSGIVAIIGRPNVGKSTIFNRLTESKDAIVDAESGVTRDRHYGKCVWNGRDFNVVDTGGYITNSDDVFEEEICKQVIIAIDEADLVLLFVDVLAGLTISDKNLADMLKRINKPVLLVVNKVDTNKLQYDATEFYSLGLGDYVCVSAVSGSGTGDLLDKVVELLPAEKPFDDEDGLPRFAIVGRPNVGKSSMVNALTGTERNIVTPIAGTTRDAVETRFSKYGFDFKFVDTAGLRKKGKVHENLEFYSVLRTIRAIENADVNILIIDAQSGMEAQDMNIFKLIEKNGKGVVVVVNKWDLVEKNTNTAKEYEQLIRRKLSPFDDVPIIFTSVLNKQRIHKVLEEAMTVHENRKRKITTSKLNNIMLEAIEQHNPPAHRGHYIKIKYVTQLPTHTPSFAFFCNHPKYVKDAYKRYLENKLRETFNFTGVPIRIFMRDK
jgi:GTPase